MKINIFYRDIKLVNITNKITEVIEVEEGLTSGGFIAHLQGIYPEIFERFKPGYLGFELNERMIEASHVLKDGDSYVFCTWGEVENDLPKPLKINVFYSTEIAKIIGNPTETHVVSTGTNFTQFLFVLFQHYPEFPKKYPLGMFKFLLNNKPPQNETLLQDNDRIDFYI